MFTTGFKFFFGLGIALVTAAVVYGYSTGGEHVGPLTLGWKGGVGDHVGYLVLMGLGVVSAGYGLMIVALRDADPGAQAHYVGVESLPPTTPVTGSFWPVVGAFGAVTAVLGLVLNTVVFIAGLAVCALVALEWSMDAWADRATGDPAANRELRNRVMAPLEIPLAGAGAAAVVVLSVSRILLNATELGAVIWAGGLAVLIFGLGILYAARPKMSKNVMAGLALTFGVAVLAGGIVAAVSGQRDFEHHEQDNHAVDHAEDNANE